MQRVHQAGALAALFFQLLGKGFLPLGHHIFGGLPGGFLHVLRAGGGSQIVGHLLGNVVVLAHKVGRAAELVAVGQPEEIQEQQVLFAFVQAVPRPTIWLYRLRTLVGRSTTTQSTLGQSQPSVSSMLLHSTL